jgi:hypothetical protein
MSESELQGLLAAIEDASIGDAPTVLAWLAGRRLELPEAELNEALRRALLLLAAGGDPHRDLDVDDRAVKAIAVDLYSEERVAALAAELDRLVLAARGFQKVSRALLFLAADLDLAWRLFALGLLAEELAGEDE